VEPEIHALVLRFATALPDAEIAALAEFFESPERLAIRARIRLSILVEGGIATEPERNVFVPGADRFEVEAQPRIDRPRVAERKLIRERNFRDGGGSWFGGSG
jgi:hypothetical protein